MKETNFVAASEVTNKPELTPAGALVFPFTSVNPCDNRDRLYAWRNKMNVVGYFEGYIFNEQDETE